MQYGLYSVFYLHAVLSCSDRTLKFDLSREGLSKVLKDYQKLAMRFVWNGYSDATSKEVRLNVNRMLGDKFGRSLRKVLQIRKGSLGGSRFFTGSNSRTFSFLS